MVFEMPGGCHLEMGDVTFPFSFSALSSGKIDSLRAKLTPAVSMHLDWHHLPCLLLSCFCFSRYYICGTIFFLVGPGLSDFEAN